GEKVGGGGRGRGGRRRRGAATQMKDGRATCYAPHTRCAPLPNQTPACQGLVTLRFAGSGQARSRLGRGWGGGVLQRITALPPPRRFAPTLPTRGRAKTESTAHAASNQGDQATKR